jgi:hypothetical protein
MARLSRLAFLALLTSALTVPLCLTPTRATAHEAAQKEGQVHSGLVVSATNDMLVMTDADGKNPHSHMVDSGAAITIDGKPAKLPDLAKGDAVQVEVGQDGKAIRISVTREKKTLFRPFSDRV